MKINAQQWKSLLFIAHDEVPSIPREISQDIYGEINPEY